MTQKKTEKADLEKKKLIFTEIGLIIALTVILFAFEWKSYDRIELNLDNQIVVTIDEDVVLNTQQNEPPPPPPPQQQTTILNIVDDDVEVDNDLDIDAEADENTEIAEYIPVETEEAGIEELEIFKVVEDPPSFPGGDEARIKFLQNNIEYPRMAMESGISGIVFVTFVVEPDGSVSKVGILRGIGGGCDEEAIRVIKAMPKWNAGKQRGKPVRVQFNMPIKFTLQ
ncbi:MAG: energy transducer TonB [Saprospiraceae bacterium]|nr:energy transducer TonB [Saprospiraceae bacterium]